MVRSIRALVVLTTLLFAWSSAGVAVSLRAVSGGQAGLDGAANVPARGMDADSAPDRHWRAELQKSVVPTVASAWRAAAFHAGLATAHVADRGIPPAAIHRDGRAAQSHAPPPATNRPLRI